MPKRSGEIRRALSDLAAASRTLAQARRVLGRRVLPGSRPYLVEEGWGWAHDLQEARTAKLLAFPGVVGHGLGFRVHGGERTSRPCLTVLVERKLAPAELPAGARLPKSVESAGRRLAIDIVELGALKRQVAGGDSIGPSPLYEQGTLGVFARDTGVGDVVALTAMHITPYQTFPVPGVASPDFASPVPGATFGSLRAGTMTGVDAAKLALDPPPASPATVLPGIGRVRGWRPTTYPGDRNTPVRMFGATSGFQTGTISNPAASLPAYDLEAAILVEIATQDGDSGSALIDPENLLLGFLVGRGSSNLNGLAVFTPASLVLAQLGCEVPSV
jgi:hypothetical protein